MTTITLLFSVAFLLIGCTLGIIADTRTKVSENAKMIAANKKVIAENKELIYVNQKLIAMINNFLSNSNMKVDWDRYSKDAKDLGIIVNDIMRNLDIDDPEG